MTKSELLKVLDTFDDSQQILVESRDGGFNSPVIYVTAVHQRPASDFSNTVHSDYAMGFGDANLGALILGTPEGFIRLA